MNADNPYRDPFLNDVDPTRHPGTHDIAVICVLIATLAFLGLAIYMTLTDRTPEMEPRSRSAARRRLMVTSALGILTGMSASFPLVLAASVNGIGSAVAWALSGTAVIALLAVGSATILVRQAAQGTGRRETDDHVDDDYHRRARGVNPATGYRMINRSIDAGGHTYGTGRDFSDDDRHWDRE